MAPLENLNKYQIILGSGSPRRQELLSGLGIEFKIQVIPDVEEIYPDNLAADEIPLYLSRLKASAYDSIIESNQLIITADTVVICNNEVMGKPKDFDEAFYMLKKLSDRTHQVITGVTIKTSKLIKSFKVITEVEVSKLTDDEIKYYIETCHPYDKAGAYGIQEWIGYIGIKGINGSFYNVMGLPLQRLYEELKQF